MNLDKLAHDKFLVGDGLVDEELDNLHDYYVEVIASLDQLDPGFAGLPLKEARSRLLTLCNYKYQREMNKT